MSKYYIYNCLLKNDVNLLSLAMLISSVHFIAFYSHESLFSTIVFSLTVLVSMVALLISLKFKVVINLNTSISGMICLSSLVVALSALQYQSNDITSIFMTMLWMVILGLNINNIKNLIRCEKHDKLPKDYKKLDLEKLSKFELMAVYKLKVYEIVRRRIYNEEYQFQEKHSLFFDEKLNLKIENNELISMDNKKVYDLMDIAHYCKESGVDITKLTSKDFEVLEMMTI